MHCIAKSGWLGFMMLVVLPGSADFIFITKYNWYCSREQLLLRALQPSHVIAPKWKPDDGALQTLHGMWHISVLKFGPPVNNNIHNNQIIHVENQAVYCNFLVTNTTKLHWKSSPLLIYSSFLWFAFQMITNTTKSQSCFKIKFQVTVVAVQHQLRAIWDSEHEFWW